MTAEQTELFHLQILRVLDLNAGKQFGLGPSSIQVLVSPFGFGTATIEQITAALDYMADSDIRFVEPVNKGQFNTANRTWKITARGINHLRANGH